MPAASGGGLVTRPDHRSLDTVRLTELFVSLQGEGPFCGLTTTFVRLTGCPLRCVWCDSAYAFHGGQKYSVADIVEQVKAKDAGYVCVTGGEPLAQKSCPALIAALCDAGFSLSLETSGALDISVVDPRVCIVMDLKAPGSGEVERNRLDNLLHLKPTDHIKVVMADRNDFDWLQRLDDEHRLAAQWSVWISPVWERVTPVELAGWLLDSGRPYRFQLQLHKVLWGDEPGR